MEDLNWIKKHLACTQALCEVILENQLRLENAKISGLKPILLDEKEVDKREKLILNKIR